MDNGQTLYVRLAAHLGDLQGGLARGSALISAYGQKADAEMARMERYAKKNQKELRTLGNVAGGVGLAAAVGIGVAIRKYAEFDKQMSAVEAATHASKNEMAALRAEAIKLGADTQFSATEAAQGIEELAKAGVSTADILGGGLKGALDLAAAGGLGVGESAEIAATALTQFNLSGKDIPHLADLLAAGAGKAQGSVTDLGSALAQTGLVASGMGLSIEDTTGTLAAFASAGMIGSDAGTSFKTMIQRLQAPMGRGAKAMEKYGISAYDAQGNFVGIADVAGQLQAKLAGLTQQQRDAALAQIFGSDAIRAATVLYKQGEDGIQGWIDKTNDAGYAAETARLRTDNLAGDIERLGGSLDTLFIGMGAGANGPMRELVQMMEGLVDVGGAMPDWMLSTVAAGLVLTAALGLAVFAATRLVGAAGATRASLGLLKAQAVGTAESLYLLTAAGTKAERAMMMRRAGKGAAAIAGIAIASGAAGDKMAALNTVSFALMGAMYGPWGAAAGAAVGGLMDIKAAGDKADATMSKLLTTVSNNQDLEKQGKQLKTLADMRDAFAASGLGEDRAEEIDKTIKATNAYRSSLQVLESQTTGYGRAAIEAFDPARAEKFAQVIGPVLTKAGLDARKVLEEGPSGKHWGEAQAAINEWKAEADTAAGRTNVLGEAFAGLDDNLITTDQSASALSKALTGLFSPTMDMDAAVQKWREGLASLRRELEKNGPTLDANTLAGGRNRAVIRDQIDALTGQMSAAAAAGHSSEYLAGMMERGRASIMRQAQAAGINGDKMSDLLNYYNLTPELVRTLIEAPGATPSKNKVKDLGVQLDYVKGQWVARVSTPGVGGAISKVSHLRQVLEGMQLSYSANVSVGVMRPKKNQADGGFYPGGVPAAANGLYNDAHVRRAGISIMRYAEAETQGETFIPHAMNKRKQSTKYLGMTAARFGYDLSPRGMESARGSTVVLQQAGRGPLVGSLTVGAGPRREVRGALDEVEKKLRKIERGGRPW